MLTDALSSFAGDRRERLLELLGSPDFTGTLPAAVVEDLAMPVEELMLTLLPAASAFAVTPISGYPVGAVVAGVSGDLHLGANYELAGLTLGCSVHAEQAAVATALCGGESGLRALAVTAAPCGHCRQFLRDLAGASTLRVLRPDRAPATLAELLPDPFGPADLGVAGGLLAGSAGVSVGEGDLAAVAIAAALRSYAPYTGCRSGVAARLPDGRVVAAPYIENSGYNPSLSPLLAVLSQLRFLRVAPEAVEAVCLAEPEGAAVSQAPLVRSVVAACMPDALLEVRSLP